MRTIRAHSGVDEAQWDAFVGTCAAATAYHQFAWRHVIARTFGHACHYLAAVDERGSWQGVLPLAQVRSFLFGNSLVSLPFVNYGGLLTRSSGAAAALLASAEELRESLGATTVELRHVDPMDTSLPTKSHKVTMLLDLVPDPERQWRELNAKVRNQIRKAQNSGLQTVIGGSELLDDFYRVFARNMRDLGSPVFPRHFFANVLDCFRESSKIIAIYNNREVAAAGILLSFRNRVEVPWASSLRKFNTLCPNNLMYWDAIRYGIASKMETFDFGRCSPDGGTYNFKKQWGAVPTALHWQYLIGKGGALPEQQEFGRKYGRAIRLWQHLPLGLSNLVGPSIRKRISL